MGAEHESRQVAFASAGEMRAFLSGCGAADIVREVVQVSGPDAPGFLQGQLSQDVLALDIGSSALTLVLEPDGRLCALARIWARPGGFWLDCDPGAGERLLARLERFRLRVKVELSLSQVRWRTLRGPASPSPDGVVLIGCEWPYVTGVDVVEADGWQDEAELCGELALESLRILVGMPRWGAELDPTMSAAETGLTSKAVSFKKGCYTGQELVERMAARSARPPRRICHLISESPLLPGSRLEAGSREVGKVASSCRVEFIEEVGSALGLSGWESGELNLATAVVHRSVSDATRLEVVNGERVEAVVRDLPLR
jgi:folate-binding protein YgfZ